MPRLLGALPLGAVMAWYAISLIVGTVIVIPQVIGLLIVALAPSRSEHVCQILREGSRVGWLLTALRQSETRDCSCETHSRSSTSSGKKS
jgi:hypothetical protein